MSFSVRRRSRASCAGLCLAGLVVFLMVGRAEAVPAFARRYRTTCQTCHVAFPVLTPFGEAFRRNGYRFPGGADQDYQRQDPVPLGASAYRDLFPRSVWPGELAANAPVSFFMTLAGLAMPGEAGRLGFMGQGTLALNAAAPVGNLLTLFAGLALDFTTSLDVTVRLQRAFAVVTPFEHPWASLRIGRMEPGLFSFSSHRMWGWSCYPWILIDVLGNTAFQIESPLYGSQLGAEITGIPWRGRLTYTAGVFRSPGAMDFSVTGYGRIGYKLGGMRLDGETNDEPAVADPAPWRERSAQFGMLGLAGQASPAGSRPGGPQDNILLAGVDANVQFDNLNVLAAYTIGHSNFPLASDWQLAPDARDRAGLYDVPSRWADVYTHNLMIQGSYVLFPWLIPSFRYEWQRRATDSRDPNVIYDCEHTTSMLTNCNTETRERFLGFVTVLIRANVRAMLVGTIQRTILAENVIEHICLNFVAGF